MRHCLCGFLQTTGAAKAALLKFSICSFGCVGVQGSGSGVVFGVRVCTCLNLYPRALHLQLRSPPRCFYNIATCKTSSSDYGLVAFVVFRHSCPDLEPYVAASCCRWIAEEGAACPDCLQAGRSGTFFLSHRISDEKPYFRCSLWGRSLNSDGPYLQDSGVSGCPNRSSMIPKRLGHKFFNALTLGPCTLNPELSGP